MQDYSNKSSQIIRHSEPPNPKQPRYGGGTAANTVTFAPNASPPQPQLHSLSNGPVHLLTSNQTIKSGPDQASVQPFPNRQHTVSDQRDGYWAPRGGNKMSRQKPPGAKRTLRTFREGARNKDISDNIGFNKNQQKGITEQEMQSINQAMGDSTDYQSMQQRNGQRQLRSKNNAEHDDDTSTDVIFGSSEGRQPNVAPRLGLQPNRNQEHYNNNLQYMNIGNHGPFEYSQQHLQQALDLMQLPDSQQQEMKIDDSQTYNMDVSQGNEERLRAIGQDLLEVPSRDPKREEGGSSFNSSRVDISQQASLSPNRKGFADRDFQKRQPGRTSNANRQTRQEMEGASNSSDKTEKMAHLQRRDHSDQPSMPDSAIHAREVPTNEKNRQSRIHIIKEKQRQLNRIQKMRDVTGEYLLSQVDMDSIAAASEVEKAAYSERMKLQRYKKSLVHSNQKVKKVDQPQIQSEVRVKEATKKPAATPQLKSQARRVAKRKKKKTEEPKRFAADDKSRNDRVNDDMKDQKSGITEDGRVYSRELVDDSSPRRFQECKDPGQRSPNPMVGEPQKKPITVNCTGAPKSLLFERNANLQDIHENAELSSAGSAQDISEGSQADNNGSAGLRKKQKSELKTPAGTATRQHDIGHLSVPHYRSSNGNVTLEQLSQQHEQREQLLFQAAAIMKLHDSCLKRGRRNHNLSQRATSTLGAAEFKSNQGSSRVLMTKNKNHSSQNQLGLGLTAMAAQHRYSEYDKNSLSIISNNFVCQQSSIPAQDLPDESNSILHNMGNSSQRINNPGSPQHPAPASVSDKISIQNQLNSYASHTPQGLKITSVTPIIGKHNRKRLEDVELIKEASMEVSHYKASQQIQRSQVPIEDAADRFKKDGHAAEARANKKDASDSCQRIKHAPLSLKSKKRGRVAGALAGAPKETLAQLVERSKQTPDTLEELKAQLSANDIPCYKYHHTVNGAPLLFDKYKAVIRLSKNGKTIKVYCFKPEVDYQSQEQKMKSIKARQKRLQKEMEEDDIKRDKRDASGQTGKRGHGSRDSKALMTSSDSSLEESQQDEEDSESSKDEAELTYEQIRKQAKRRRRKLRDDNVVFKKTKSWATCNVDEIEGFIYGPFSSRFWMMRKHINSVDNTKGKKVKLPFYAWQCLSLQLRHRSLDLVIEEDCHMKSLLQFLILSLRTVDGQRHSALPHLNYALRKQFESDENLRQLYEAKNSELKHVNRVNLQTLSEATCKKFTMLKIRMKLSFLAFVRNQTITEMFLRTILESYNHRNQKGLVANPWPKMDKQLIGKIMAGANEGHKFRDKSGRRDEIGKRKTSESSSASSGIEKYLNQHKERVQLDHYQTAKQRTFALKAMDKNRVVDIFKGILDKQDHHMPADQIANGWVQFKFERARIGLSISRLQLLRNLGFTAGPTAIKYQLKIIDLEKEMFSLMLTRGTEVKIPHALDQTRLPYSFRFYDPIINLIKLNFSGQNRDFSKLKRSISYAFDQKFQSHSLFRVKEDSGKLKAQHNFRRKENKDFDFMNSQHTMQIQQSKYITLDDNFVDQASRIKKQIENSGQYLNKYQKEQRLFDELGVVNIKYIHKDQLLKEKQKSLTIKRMFAQQLSNLRQKGERLQLMAMVDDKVIEPLQNRVLTLEEEEDGARGDRKNMRAGMQRLLSGLKRAEAPGAPRPAPDEEPKGFVFDMFARSDATAAEVGPAMALEKEIIYKIALREEKSTNALLEQLERGFKPRFQDLSHGHSGKALKAQTDELLAQSSALTEQLRQRNLERQRRAERDYFKENERDFERKHKFVDRSIEHNVLFFCPQFDDKEKQRRVMGKIVEHNEAILQARDQERQVAQQAELQLRLQNKTQSVTMPQEVLEAPQPNAAGAVQESARQPLRKIQTSQGINVRQLMASSANKSIFQSKQVMSSTKASNNDKTKTFSNFSQAKGREYFSQDTSTPSIRKTTHLAANDINDDKLRSHGRHSHLPLTLRGSGAPHGASGRQPSQRHNDQLVGSSPEPIENLN